MSRRLYAGLPLLALALAALVSLRRLDNTDTWWHMAGGRWIVSHHAIPANDPLSWTVPDHPWTNVQWLFDVFVYQVYQLGGASLLVMSAVAAYTLATGFMVLGLRRHVGPVLTTLLASWAVVASHERFAIRPEMATFLLLQVMLWLYATGREPGSKRLWLLPVVMCVWANCHSLFSTGMVVILCHVAAALVTDLPLLPRGWRRSIDPAVRRRVLATGTVAIAATLLNPFGLEGALFPLRLMSRFSSQYRFFSTIGEFQSPFDSAMIPTFAMRAYRVLLIVSVPLVLAALGLAAKSSGAKAAGDARSRRDRRKGTATSPPATLAERESEPGPAHLDLALVGVFAGFAYLSVLARRNTPLFAMGGGLAIASALAVLMSRLPALARTATRARAAVAVVLVAAILGAGGFVATNGYYRWINEFRETGLGVLEVQFPIRAAAFVKAHRLPGPLFNDFRIGGYLSWSEPIPGGVYVDGRTEVYEVEFLDLYYRQLTDPPAWQAEMDRRNVQTVVFFHWWPNHQPLLRHLLTDPRWALVYFDETVVVTVRREGNAEVIARALADFAGERAANERRLLAPAHSWQWPVAQARGVKTYAALLATGGRTAEAQRFLDRASELQRTGR